MNIGLLLPRHVRNRPDHIAVAFGGLRLTFRAFNARVNRLANALLSLGVVKGDKIATVLPNSLAQLETYWAAAKIGAVVVPLSNLLREKALAALLRDSDATMVIATLEFAEMLPAIQSEVPNLHADRILLCGELHASGFASYEAVTAVASGEEPTAVEIADSDPYNIIYSSGTTGDPKGIVHTHCIRAMYCTQFASAWRMTPESVVLHAGSIIFNGAFLTLMPALYTGATYILHKSFDPEVLIETVQRERVTHLMMVPSQVIALLHSARFDSGALESLQMICSVGAPLHREHKETLTRALPNRFYELYGLTEGFITVLDRDHYAAKPDSVGLPLPFFEMRILDDQGTELPPGEVGEIVGRGPLLTPGYYKRPDLTRSAIVDGWLHTGDLGFADADGFLHLVDRKKDMIISGGVNVYPTDIEEIVVQHPAVREAAVFGIPSEKWGETPLAAVILREPGAVTAEELCDWINHRVDARNQRVHKVEIHETFPRSPAGKTLKRVLREPYWSARQERI